YDEIDFLHNPFSNYDYFAAKQEGKYGVIDHDGNEILPFIYDMIEPNVTNHELNRQLAVVSKNKKFGVVDLNNNMIIPFEYEEIGILSDESLCVKKNNQIKIVDFSLKQVSDTKFQYIGLRNNEGCFCAIKDNIYGAIDKMGKTVIDFKYDYMCPLDKGFFVAQQGEKNNQGIIDKDDNIVTAFKYNFSKNVIYRERSIIKAKIGSKYGLINYATGEVVLDFIYDEMRNSYIEDKCIFVRQGEKEFCFNPKGDLIPF
ncbi:MAG: WG repeat-containing protein, partial [Candidatus Gastranaerophilales bacterium]|nr:WG repeat-containing protein [Candidatus Gastranaerophilales bacterium]